MVTRRIRTFTLGAGFGWLAVAGYGLISIIADNDDDWQAAYLALSAGLLVGTVLGIVVVASATRDSDHPRLRKVGLIVSGVAAAASIMAWALPLWMTLLGVGFAMIAKASAPQQRRPLALLAAGQLIGLAVLFTLLVAEVGRRDEWGDHPAAGGFALIVTAAITIIALFELTKSRERRPVSARAPHEVYRPIAP